MLDHIGLTVTDFAKSRAFFDAALAPLGIGMIMEVTPEQTGGSSHLGYGSERRPYFWIGDAGPATGQVHVALTAADHASVPRPWRPAGGTTVRPGSALTTTRTITAPSSSTRTATTLRRSVMPLRKSDQSLTGESVAGRLSAPHHDLAQTHHPARGPRRRHRHLPDDRLVEPVRLTAAASRRRRGLPFDRFAPRPQNVAPQA
jgi:catechol 2,3-dioxygenase-like lactoylglutathione lyase family enzyme